MNGEDDKKGISTEKETLPEVDDDGKRPKISAGNKGKKILSRESRVM